MFSFYLSRPVQAMPVVVTNSLGQVTLNSSSILTTGVPVTVANASAPPKLVIQALPTVLPTSSKAGEKITIITIPANQLATLMQANSSGQITQLIQTKPAASTPTVQLTGGRTTPQLILAKPAAVTQPLPQLSVQVGQQQPGPPKNPYQQPKPSNIQPENTQPEAFSVAPPLSSLSSPSAKPSSSWELCEGHCGAVQEVTVDTAKEVQDYPSPKYRTAVWLTQMPILQNPSKN